MLKPTVPAVLGYTYTNPYLPDRDGCVVQIVERAYSPEHGLDVPTFVISATDGWRHVARAEHLQPWYPLEG